jgi:hypothetical protein
MVESARMVDSTGCWKARGGGERGDGGERGVGESGGERDRVEHEVDNLSLQFPSQSDENWQRYDRRSILRT